MKVLVTGVNGQLGHDVINELSRRVHTDRDDELSSRAHTVVGSDISAAYEGIQDGSAVCNAKYCRMDITDAACVNSIISDIKPDAIVHCAAWTNVDGAELEENRATAYKINVEGTRNIAAACAATGAKLVYITSDYVFNGKGEKPWEADDTAYEPLNYYGETKLGGELCVKELLDKYFIIRISWAFGLNGNNFIKTMLKLSERFDTIRVVDDQIGSPSYTFDLAYLIADMIETEKYGCYNATNEGEYISWYEFAKEIFCQANRATDVIPVSTEEYGVSVAERPKNSRMSKDKLEQQGFGRLPDWKDALHRYLAELEKHYSGEL